MAASELETNALESPTAAHELDMSVHVSRDHQHPLDHDRNLKPSLDPAPANNTSAHELNGQIHMTDTPEPLTNGGSAAHISKPSQGSSDAHPSLSASGLDAIRSSNRSGSDDMGYENLDTGSEGAAQIVNAQEQEQQRDPNTLPQSALLENKSELISKPQTRDTQLEAVGPNATARSDTPHVADQIDREGELGATSSTQNITKIATKEIQGHPPVPLPEGTVPEAPIDPAPSPAQLTEPAPSNSVVQNQPTDQIMQDAPSTSVKTTREREDDEFAEAPAAKRSKTDESSDSSGFKVPERPATAAQETNGASEVSHLATSDMTKPQQKFLQRTIGNVKRIAAAKAFTSPVDYVALNLPRYPEIIKQPMDLKTLEDKLRADKYASAEACVADFNQIIQNTHLFNGPDHLVTKQALEMKASFDKQFQQLPGPDIKEPTALDRKKKVPDSMAVKISHSRRESRSSLPGSARSPPSASSPQTFALGPEGVPLIRRDSTLGDGRPKREIHRPAPRDLPYANQKPKKKKYQTELRFCDKVLSELSKPKYASVSYPFMTPVDPVALNIPSYHSIIKKPMDFGTIKTKLDRGEYEKAAEFEADVRLVFQNCYKFNRPGDIVSQAGHQFEEVFNAEWSSRHQWIDSNTLSSGPQSPGSSSGPEESEDEVEVEEEEEEQTQLTKLQQQIAAMSRQVELITQKKKSPPAPTKKAIKSSKSGKKDTKKAIANAAPKTAKKAAASRPAKQEKIPCVTYEQKQDISNRINSLSETKMATALKIIRDNMPNLKGVEDDELELDIDELSNDVLYKLFTFVKRNAPRPDDSPAPRLSASSSGAAPSRKKNKPMSKHEQEARIAQVESGLSAFQHQSAPNSGGHIEQSVENQASDEEDDDDEDSESEEE